MTALLETPMEGPLADRMAQPPRPGLRMVWLGQAGFVIEVAGCRIVVDPYLSDSLAAKYRGKRFAHERMMPAPIRPEEIRHVDLVLATHHHTDHMDAETLRPLLAASPRSRLVAPAASAPLAMERANIGPDRLLAIDAGETITPFDGVRITATPAAHEARERDEAGRHRFLGYVLDGGGARLWHSGDCVPFDGLREAVTPLQPTVALLPVNGRDPGLAAAGVPGNFSVGEAVEIARDVGALAVVAHHHGLFAFNTADPAAIDDASLTAPLPLHRAKTGMVYALG